jgi:hypothetical protein
MSHHPSPSRARNAVDQLEPNRAGIFLDPGSRCDLRYSAAYSGTAFDLVFIDLFACSTCRHSPRGVSLAHIMWHIIPGGVGVTELKPRSNCKQPPFRVCRSGLSGYPPETFSLLFLGCRRTLA